MLLAVFAYYQRRRVQPLIDPRLFGEPTFSTGLLAVQVFWMGQASFFVILALYLQFGRHLSALQSGAVFMAIGAGYLLTSMTAHRLAARLGRHVVTAGALIMVAGLAAMTYATLHGIEALLPGLALDGIGMGMALAPLTTVALSRVAPEHTGAAAGVLSTVNQTGNALGVALIGIVFYQAGSYADGFRAGVLALIVVELILAGLIQLLPRR